jgi:dTDP-4-amino-4,6-dideoxygalactose transaminase
MRVPLVDLKAGFLPIREELRAEFEKILDGMELFLGPNVRAFEREFAAYCGVAHGIAVSSGTDALLAALLACKLGAGDEVICPSLTFFATVEAILHARATPVLVDVEPTALTIDPDAIRAALGPRTRAIVAVHLYGHPAQMDAIRTIAAEHGLRVIEDCAQAHGARTLGAACGSLGDAGCFSFYYTKNLGAFGEAGFVATNDAALAERVRLLRDHGQSAKSQHQILGYNFRMDELQAAVLRLKLRRLDAGNARRREIAAHYRSAFAGSEVRPVGERAGCEHVHHLFPIRVADRDGLRRELDAAGIATGVHYDPPGHCQPALSRHPHRCGKLEVTERACRELVSLPIYPELRDEQRDHVVREVLRSVGRSGPRSGR